MSTGASAPAAVIAEPAMQHDGESGEDGFVVLEGVPVGAAPPAPAPPAGPSLTHTVRGDRSQYTTGAQSAHFMVSLQATQHTPAERKPVDIVLVIDKSGSMRQGGKMELTIETAELVAKELAATDRLSIVTYDAGVYCPMPLTKMDKDGKKLAEAAIATIAPGSTTNLSGGLLRGVEELAAPAAGDLSETTSILLLTDGLANVGIQDTAGIVRCLEGALGAIPKPPSVFTFGVGADHDAEMLRTIADAGGGVYYFVEDGDAVASSFADCLGGLLSVVGQNVRLAVSARGGASVVRLLGNAYKSTTTAAGGGGGGGGGGDDGQQQQRIEVALGDVYSEEQKDLVFEVALPAAGGGAAADSAAEVTAELSYFDVVQTAVVSKRGATSGPMARAETAGEKVVEVEAQLNRLVAAEAIKEATRLARESGDFAGGRERLRRTRMTMQVSPAGSSALCRNLLDDLATAETSLQDAHSYERRGKYTMESMAQCHSVQRSNTSSASPYKIKSKMAMQSRWEDGRSERKRSVLSAAGGGGGDGGGLPPRPRSEAQSAPMTKPGWRKRPGPQPVPPPQLQQQQSSGVLASMASYFGCGANRGGAAQVVESQQLPVQQRQ